MLFFFFSTVLTFRKRSHSCIFYVTRLTNMVCSGEEDVDSEHHLQIRLPRELSSLAFVMLRQPSLFSVYLLRFILCLLKLGACELKLWVYGCQTRLDYIACPPGSTDRFIFTLPKCPSCSIDMFNLSVKCWLCLTVKVLHEIRTAVITLSGGYPYIITCNRKPLAVRDIGRDGNIKGQKYDQGWSL